MKKLITLLFTLFTLSVFAQKEEINYSEINPEPYLTAFNYYRLHNVSDNEVLFVKVREDDIKEYSYKKWEISHALYKWYHNKDYHFKLGSTSNSGYVIVIIQLNKDETIIRYFTLFIDEYSQKIKVIEVEENK
jgi:hypothetical protein